VGNALKYTCRGGRVSISARLGHDSVRIEVHDTGLGIRPAEWRRSSTLLTKLVEK
jgi:signal transduction histidine kinase